MFAILSGFDLGEVLGKVDRTMRLKKVHVEQESVWWHSKLSRQRVEELLISLIVTLPKTNYLLPISTWSILHSED